MSRGRRESRNGQPWQGNTCVERHVKKVLSDAGPYDSAKGGIASFFGFDPGKVKQLEDALQRLGNAGVIDVRLPNGSTKPIYSI